MAAEQYPFVERDPRLGAASLAPLLPVQLTGPNAVSALGLLDTGATVNVLPYALGEQMGLVWDQQRTSITLSGNLAACEARAVVLSARRRTWTSIRSINNESSSTRSQSI